MPSDVIWRQLPLSTSPDVPTLLVSVDIGTAAYTIQVTDMANIWVESLDRKAICMRGWGENTSIDPSDTPENMSKFLASLRTALDPSQEGHNQTGLTLSPGSPKEAGEDGLTIKVTCPLPGFQPLTWPFYLKKSPTSSIATDLVLPLVEAHLTRKLEVESLVQALSYKDTVISKLVDKLESTGTGLENVFTALSGRKKVSRAVAEERVKGLAPFDARKWRLGLKDNENWPTTANDLVQKVFGGAGLQSSSVIQVEASPELDNWWHGFKDTSQMPRQTQQPDSLIQKTSPTSTTSGTDDDDDFQVQPTPPHLQSEKNNIAKRIEQPVDDVSTEEDDENSHLDLPETNFDNATTKPAPRIGLIGKKKPIVSPPSPKAKIEQLPQGEVQVLDDDTETASEASDDDAPAPVLDIPSSSTAPAKASPKKGPLGKIGGPASKASATTKTKTPEPDDASAKELETSPPVRKKLGVIGKKIVDTTIPSSSDDGRTGRGSERQVEAQETNQPRETSQERADRRREELKRELEKKAAAGPAKKKRRF